MRLVSQPQHDGRAFFREDQFQAFLRKCSTGSITPGREYIIYAEGDVKIIMNQHMTVTEFAQKNTGNYLVVTAQLN